jgi:hypothetical protein|tara:strand:- start:207 stop:431 length:225 start_codon:yes stop_codon:yes gene_type:complete
MSCNLRKQTLEALRSQCKGNIDKARVNVEIYLHNPVGIGEHSDILAAIQDQIDLIAKEEERLEVIDRHFTNHHE